MRIIPRLTKISQENFYIRMEKAIMKFDDIKIKKQKFPKMSAYRRDFDNTKCMVF